MTELLKAWKTSRALLVKFLENYSIDQLNHIPKGFNNNIIWNIGHIIVAQQGLIYRGSKLEPKISDALMDKYKPGTKPDGKATAADIDELKHLLTSLVDNTERDLQKGIFKEYSERVTKTGFHLASIEDALHFNNFHEGLHLGVMMGIRKFV